MINYDEFVIFIQEEEEEEEANDNINILQTIS